MIISERKKFIFIHIYKTGGNSLKSILLPYARLRERISQYYPTKFIISLVNNIFKINDYGNSWINGVHKHSRAIEVKDYLGEHKYNEYFKFTVVRNPYDLNVSLYHYIKQHKNHKEYKIANDLNFKEFMYYRMSNNTLLQSDFLIDENENLLVDCIIKLEEIDDSMKELFEKIDVKNKNIPKKNASDRREDYSFYYDKDLKKDVYKYFKRDFDLLNYKKPI